jgi:hypothetical protein
MVIEIKKPITRAKLENAGKQIRKSRKKQKSGFNSRPFFGKVKWGMDGVALQRMMRDEWA